MIIKLARNKFLFLALDLKFKGYSGWQESHSNCDMKMVGISSNYPTISKK